MGNDKLSISKIRFAVGFACAICGAVIGNVGWMKGWFPGQGFTYILAFLPSFAAWLFCSKHRSYLYWLFFCVIGSIAMDLLASGIVLAIMLPLYPDIATIGDYIFDYGMALVIAGLPGAAVGLAVTFALFKGSKG